MNTTTTRVCEVCGGTGWDPTFGSACGVCDADLPTREAVEAAIAEAEALSERVRQTTDEWTQLIDFAREQGGEFFDSIVRQFDRKGELSTRQWDALRNARERAHDDKVRCFKLDGEWIAYGPEGLDGKTTLTTRKGERTIWITGTREEKFRGRTSYTFSWDEPGDGDSVLDGEGFYVASDGRVVKVQLSKSGHLYGKVLDDDDRFTYDPGAVRLVERKLTVEEAAAFGRRTGRCMVCSRTLTNPESIEAGIGPICASKL